MKQKLNKNDLSIIGDIQSICQEVIPYFFLSVCLSVCFSDQSLTHWPMCLKCPNKLPKYTYVSDFDFCPSSDKRPGIYKRKNLNKSIITILIKNKSKGL